MATGYARTNEEVSRQWGEHTLTHTFKTFTIFIIKDLDVSSFLILWVILMYIHGR